MSDTTFRPDPAWIRQPVVAGRFYPGEAKSLRQEVAGYLAEARPGSDEPILLAMVPHAGYIFSGAVAGRTLGAAPLAETILLLGPNHTGRGTRLAVWAKGAWSIPGVLVPVDEPLAKTLLAAVPALTVDREAHLGEHSLEVVLPFLVQRQPKCRIVPVVVSERSPDVLQQTAVAMAGAFRSHGEPVTVVVSSDMSHYVPHDVARQRDAMALSRAVALDPAGLYDVVRRAGISMCGVLPMSLGLWLALELGARQAELVAYATSGETTGDMEQVVGYAGILAR